MAGRTREAVSRAMSYDTGFESRVREAVVTYFEASISDPDVQKLLTEVYSKACRAHAGEFSRWLERLGSPLVIRDPLTGGYVEFSGDYAAQVSSAIRDGRVSRDALYQSVKEAALARLQRLLRELGG